MESKKILFLTNRNILTTSGELRLIKNRAEELYNSFGVVTDFIAFQKPARIKAPNKEGINTGGTTDTYPLAPLRILSTFKSYKSLKRAVKNKLDGGEYGMVIISGFLLIHMIRWIKNDYDVPVVLDLHGAAEDSLELARVSGFKKKIFFNLIYAAITKTYKKYSQYADGCLAVTQALEEYFRKNFETNDNVHFYHVPCATNSLCQDKDIYLANRKEYRKKYGISEDEIVFIYSGGVSAWQCVEETILLYKQLSSSLNKKTRMLVFSHSFDTIKRLAGKDDSIQIDSYGPDELVKALCAGDYAFLLRKDCITNNVAFPNKFLEYVQSGMRIITTPYVYEIARQVENYSLGVLYKMDGDINCVIQYIENDCEKRQQYTPELINEVLNYNSFGNRLPALVADIK